MRYCTLLALFLALIATASAIELNTNNIMPEKEWSGQGGDYDGIRVGGDTIASAVAITIPGSDTGNTCDFNHDYDEVCPYTDSTAPDVVYSYACAADIVVDIDLCASTYDTKVYVYENDEFTLVGCNDDCCALQSLLTGVAMTVGNTYYIVVDGYGSSCGFYDMQIIEHVPCVIECPPGAMMEGEPDCYDGYDDVYNSGCNALSYPPIFQTITPSCDPIVICGTSGVFEFGTYLFRDSDWFELSLPESATICLGADATFGMLLASINAGDGCHGLTFEAYGLPGPCMPIYDICWDASAGTYWVVMVPSSWDLSYECGTSIYWIEITGYTGGLPSPAGSSSWGDVKALFR